LWTLFQDQTIVQRHVPMTGVTFTDSLTSGGGFQGTYEWDFPGTDVDVINRVCVWPMRDGAPQGCYLLNKKPSTNMLSPAQQVSGVRVDHVLWKRLIRQTLTFLNVDQHDIFRDLMRYGLGLPTLFASPAVNPDSAVSGSMQVPWFRFSSNISGQPLMTRQETPGNTDDGYPGASRKNVGNCLTQLTQIENGPEYKLAYGLDPATGLPYVLVVLGTPRVGHGTDFPAKPVFEFPGGNVLTCSYGADGDTLVTRADVLGQDQGGTKPIGTATWTDALNEGLPLYEDVTSESSVSQQNTLDVKAARRLAGHTEGWSITVSGQRSPVFGSWEIGDFVFMRVKRLGKKQPISAVRVTGWSIKVDDSGLSETITPTIETVPSFLLDS